MGSFLKTTPKQVDKLLNLLTLKIRIMNLKEQLESARNYALERIQKGEFKLIDAFYDERLGDVRCLIEIDGYQISFVIVLEKDFMFQSSSHRSNDDIIEIVDIIIFNRAIEIPERIKEIAKNL